MDRNIFELASRQAVRFSSDRGELSTEQLWDLPLTARNNFDLDTVARTVARELKDLGEESFVDTKPNPKKAAAELKLEVVKHIIGYKQELKAAAETRAQNAEKREQLQRIIASKQANALEDQSLEDLQAQLKALED